MNIETLFNIILALVNNAFILISLVFFYTATNYDLNTKNRKHQIIAGLLIGLASMLIMNQPYNITDGLFIDSRTILFSIIGHFFGLVPTILGTVIAVTYRLVLDGEGVYIGVMAILVNGLLGIFWTMYRHKFNFKNKYIEYYIFSLITQSITVILYISLPTINDIIIPLIIAYVGLYPLAGMLVAVVIIKQRSRLLLSEKVNTQKTLMKKSLDAIQNIEIFTLNKEFNYLTYNNHHKKQMKRYNKVDINENSNFIDLIKNDYLRDLLKEKIDESFDNQALTKVVNTGMNYYEYEFTPVTENDQIIAVTCLAKDVTNQKKYEELILKQGNQDALTQLGNRRHFMALKDEYDKYNTLSVICCDVNGLKVINDAFGHEVGDTALVSFANILKNIFETHGDVFRMGGDEFSIILPNKDKKFSTTLMESVNKKLEERVFQKISLSVSYGIATTDDTTRIDNAIRLAEEQMYRQKLFETHSYRSKFIETILQSLNEKNPSVEQHSERVSRICLEIGKKMQMTKYELNLLKVISSLHDIGKIAIDEAILNKKDALTEEEWLKIKRHPEIGYRIISSSPEYQEIAYDILSHHERYDGKGYPQGLKGIEIPIRARIVNLADSFDAMVSDRIYKKKISLTEAIDEIKRCSGTQFDPVLVDIFIELYHEGVFNEKKTE